jgi:hypothetical protein
VAERLTEVGAHAGVEATGSDRARPGRSLRVLVGPWRAIRDDPAASLRGPGVSGVFASFKPGGRGRYELVLADPRAAPRCRYRAGAGLVAAEEAADGAGATWLVTGTDRAGVKRAADALDSGDLRHRYAVAVPAAGPSLNVPVDASGGDRARCGDERAR